MLRKEQLYAFAMFLIRLHRKVVPLLTLSYALHIIVLTVFMSGKLSPFFLFLCLEMFLNWYCVHRISYKSTPVIDNWNLGLKSRYVSSQAERGGGTYKNWYCNKCQIFMCKPVRHCDFCGKCYHFKDHHCWLLGICLLRQNMGNFILCCFYASLASLYSVYVIGCWIYQYVKNIKNDSADFTLFENFCFPVAVVKLLLNNFLCTVLFIVFIAQIFVHWFCMGNAFCKLSNCLKGKQAYAYLTGKQTLKDIFGNHGLMNIILPYNGLVAKRYIDDCRYQLKEV